MARFPMRAVARGSAVPKHTGSLAYGRSHQVSVEGRFAHRHTAHHKPQHTTFSLPSRRLVCAGNSDAEQNIGTLIERMEMYTQEVPTEVLLVKAMLEEGMEDEVLVFRGFSSSLMRPTPDDPSEPVLPESCTLESVDRLQGPYIPNGEQVSIQEGMSVKQITQFLDDLGF